MRPNLSQETLKLVNERIHGHGALTELSKKSGVHYHKLYRWVTRRTPDLPAADMQLVYEAITGKQLEY